MVGGDAKVPLLHEESAWNSVQNLLSFLNAVFFESRRGPQARMLSTSEEQHSCLMHLLSPQGQRCSTLCKAFGALGPARKPATFVLLTRFAALLHSPPALVSMEEACFANNSEPWAALLLTHADPVLAGLSSAKLVNTLLGSCVLEPLFMAGVRTAFSLSAEIHTFVPLPGLHPEFVLDRCLSSLGTLRYFKQTQSKAVYDPANNVEVTVAEWIKGEPSNSYLCDVVADYESLELWEKSNPLALYVHAFDLHRAIRSASLIRCGPR